MGGVRSSGPQDAVEAIMRASGEAILREFMTNERYPVQPGATGFTG